VVIIVNFNGVIFCGICEYINDMSCCAQMGPNSGLHIIIFDEIDAICKARGSVAGSTAVHDTVVNQLLSKIDGVDQLNNILVIGRLFVTVECLHCCPYSSVVRWPLLDLQACLNLVICQSSFVDLQKFL